MELFICQYNDLLPTSETRSEFNYLIQEQPSLEIISVGCEIHSTRILYSCLSISSTDRDTSSDEPTMSKDIYVSTVNLPTPPSMSHSTVNLLPLHPCQTSFYLMCNILLSISPPFIHVKFNCQFPPPPSMLYFPVSLPYLCHVSLSISPLPVSHCFIDLTRELLDKGHHKVSTETTALLEVVGSTVPVAQFTTAFP